MAQFQNQELEYVIDDEFYDMTDSAYTSSFEDNDSHSRTTFAADSMDSDCEDDFEQVTCFIQYGI